MLSNWMRRLWTLQEGVFAASIHFLLSDGTKSLRDLISGNGDSGKTYSVHRIQRKFVMSLVKMLSYEQLQL